MPRKATNIINDEYMLKEMFEHLKEKDITVYCMLFLMTRTCASAKEICDVKLSDITHHLYKSKSGIKYVFSEEFEWCIRECGRILYAKSIPDEKTPQYEQVKRLSTYIAYADFALPGIRHKDRYIFCISGNTPYTPEYLSRRVTLLLKPYGYNMTDFLMTGVFDYFKLTGEFPEEYGGHSIISYPNRIMTRFNIDEETYYSYKNQDRHSAISIFSIFDDKVSYAEAKATNIDNLIEYCNVISSKMDILNREFKDSADTLDEYDEKELYTYVNKINHQASHLLMQLKRLQKNTLK